MINLNSASSKTDIDVSWVKITPAKAKALLDHTKKSGFPQRPISSSTATRYAKEMGKGTWHSNTADVIRLCYYKGEWAVVDGRHRLTACAQAGIEFHSFVATGVPEEAFKYIDQGKSRILSDIMGAAGWPVATIMSTAVLMLELDSRGKVPCGQRSSAPLSSGSMYDIANSKFSSLKTIWFSYGTLVKQMSKGAKCVDAVSLFFFYQAEKFNHDRAVEVLRYFSSPTEVDAPATVYEFARERLIENKEEYMKAASLGRKVASEVQKADQLQLLRFAWLVDTQNINKVSTQSGFNKTYNKWFNNGGSIAPWSLG